MEESDEEESEEARQSGRSDISHGPPEKTTAAGKTQDVSLARHDTVKRDEAAAELRQYENLALLSCFLGPLFGAYLLHAIRGQLTRPSEGLVSNFNLTIFVLAAELRPCSHLITLVQARTLHLQRVVESNTSDIDKIQSDQISDLSKRLEEVEARAADTPAADTPRKFDESAAAHEINVALRQSFQPQVDALNRAVRRYEKRAATQTMQYEARLQNLEDRLADALALAAVAAKHSQRPGVIMTTLEWFSHVFMLPVQVLWTLVTWPVEAATNVFTCGKTWIFGGQRRRDGKGKQSAKEKDSSHRVAGGAQRPLSKSSRR